MILDKKQIELLKDLEIKLHYAHEAIREFNKDIHCDNGQEYPVPVPPSYKKDNLPPGAFNPKNIGIDGYEYEEDIKEDYK